MFFISQTEATGGLVHDAINHTDNREIHETVSVNLSVRKFCKSSLLSTRPIIPKRLKRKRIFLNNLIFYK